MRNPDPTPLVEYDPDQPRDSDGRWKKTMFHVSSTRNRPKIRREGLDPKAPKSHKAEYESGVYLWDTFEAAWKYLQQFSMHVSPDADIHAVDASDVDLTRDPWFDTHHPDRAEDFPGAWFTKQRIGPERVSKRYDNPWFSDDMLKEYDPDQPRDDNGRWKRQLLTAIKVTRSHREHGERAINARLRRDHRDLFPNEAEAAEFIQHAKKVLDKVNADAHQKARSANARDYGPERHRRERTGTKQNVGSITPKSLVALVKKQGFSFSGQQGSHAKFVHSDGRSIIVPVHARDLKKGLALKILNDVGLSRNQLWENAVSLIEAAKELALNEASKYGGTTRKVPTRGFSSYSAGRGPNARGETTVSRNFKTGAYRKYNVSGKPVRTGSGGASAARVKMWKQVPTGTPNRSFTKPSSATVTKARSPRKPPMYVWGKLRTNTSKKNPRNGQQFRSATVGGRKAHVYGSGANRKVIVLKKPTASTRTKPPFGGAR